MSKCNKVKNPCKICLGSVSPRTGLQCQGACATWVHYACLNYTPGKVRDIKAGIIKVTCPCPDCKTTMPKEFRTDQPYSCNNSQCPANRPPKCDNHACPINGRCPRPAPPPCPLSKCGNDCKTFSTPQALGSTGGSGSCTPPPCRPAECPPNPADCCLPPKCPSGCSSANISMSGGGGGGGGGACPPPPCPPPPCPPPPCPPNMNVVEQMCNTVNQLTNQINELMIQMKRAASDKPPPPGKGCCPQVPKSTCVQQGPKDLCPKPCFCPGNPGRR